MQQLHTVAGRGRGRKSQFIESIDGTSLSGWAWAEAVLAALRAAQTENGRRRHPGVYGLVIGRRGGGVGDGGVQRVEEEGRGEEDRQRQRVRGAEETEDGKRQGERGQSVVGVQGVVYGLSKG